MAVIRVPKTPKKAFNKNRRPSALLLGQIEHLEWAVLPASQRKPQQLPKRKVTTEAQAAERVARLTTMVLAAKALAVPPPAGAAVLVPVTLPPLPPVPTDPRAKRPLTPSKTKSPTVRRTVQRKTTMTAKKASRPAGHRRTRR